MTPQQRARTVVDSEPENLEMEIQAQIEAALLELLARAGSQGTCRGCGADIFWVKHTNGKNVPYGRNGLNHFATCSKADSFRKEVRNEKR